MKKKVLGWFIATKSSYNYFVYYHKKLRQKKAKMQCKWWQKYAQFYPFSYSSKGSYKAKLFSINKKNLLTLLEIFGLLKKMQFFVG